MACSKDSGNADDTPTPAKLETVAITGDVILPIGSVYNANTLQVVSPVGQAAVQSGHYAATGFKDEVTTQMVVSPTGEVVLMGLQYPGQTDFTIDTRSTVLAMALNTPAAYSLDVAGKKRTIAAVLADPGFAPAMQEIQTLLALPAPLLDPSHAVLAQRLSALFANVSRRNTASAPKPVRVRRAGRELVFDNAIGLGHATVVGVYKDGVRQQQLVVGPVNFVPTSLAEIYLQYTGGIDPVSVPYTMNGDGNFQFKIRTGRPDTANDSPEARAAYEENLGMAAIQLLEAALPQLKYIRTSDCLRGIALRIKDKVKLVTTGPAASTPGALGYYVLAIANQVGEDIKGLLECSEPAATKGAASSFWSKIGKWYGYLDIIGRIGSTANVSKFVFDWSFTAPAHDTCFQATGNTVQSSCCEDAAMLALLTGGSSKTWRYVAEDGRAVTPYCGNYDTETFTTNHLYSRVIWGGPLAACTPTTNSITYHLCGQKIGWAGTNGVVGFPYTITTLTANRLVFLAPADGGIHSFEFAP